MRGKLSRAVVVTVTCVLVASVAVGQTKKAKPNPGGKEWGNPADPGAIIWDFGPSTGVQAGCWANTTESQNFAEQVSFASPETIVGIFIFTCIGPVGGTVHIKILDDDGAGNPGTVLYSEDRTPDIWVSDPTSGGFMVGVNLAAPFAAAAGTTYWVGVSGNSFELGQFSVQTPGDGLMAQFSGSAFAFHTGVGDQMFQLLDSPVPVELEAFEIER